MKSKSWLHLLIAVAAIGIFLVGAPQAYDAWHKKLYTDCVVRVLQVSQEKVTLEDVGGTVVVRGAALVCGVRWYPEVLAGTDLLK